MKIRMISVVIPVYNVRSLLARCLDSLVAQTFTDWEAICVDDGSTDGSSAVLDEYADRDGRIRVFHTENRGVSNARNLAMEQVRGEYVLIVDSDDFIHPQTMEICLRRIEADESDAVMFYYDREYRTKAIVRHFLHLSEPKPSFRIINEEKSEYRVSDDIFSLATEYSKPKGIDPKWAIKHCQPWRGMYRSSIVKDVKFVSGIIYEDFPWWSEVLLNIRRVTVLREQLYFYYPNFKGYIMTTTQNARIRSLQLAVDAALKVYADVDGYRREQWEKNFLAPVTEKLKKKQENFR